MSRFETIGAVRASQLPRSLIQGIVLAITIAAWGAYAALARTVPGVSHDAAPYDRNESAWTQVMVPALAVPTSLPSFSTAAARAAMTVAGRSTAARDLAVGTSALTVLAIGEWLLDLDLDAFSVIAVLVAMSVSASFWWRATAWRPDTLAPLAAVVAGWCAGRSVRSSGRALPALAIAAALLAISEDTAWLALLPAVLVVAYRQRVHVSRSLGATVIVLLLIAAAWPFIMRWWIATHVAGPLIAAPVPGPFSLWRDSVNAAPRPQPDDIAALFGREFTAGGALLAVLGLMLLFTESAHAVAAATAAAGLLAWTLLAPRPASQHLSMPVALCGWSAVAVAFTWIRRNAKRVPGTLFVAAATIAMAVAPLGASFDWSPSQALMADDARAVASAAITDLPGDAVFVSENTRVDQALRFAAARAERSVTLIPRNADAVEKAAASHTVIAFRDATDQLKRHGFLFDRGYLGEVPADTVVGRAACVTLEAGRWSNVTAMLGEGAFTITGATSTVTPGQISLRLAGVDEFPVSGTDPRRDYEIVSAPGSSEVELVVPRPREALSVVMTLTSAPRVALARADDPAGAQVCPAPQRTDLLLAGARRAVTIPMTSRLFGHGWSGPEYDPDVFRWTSDSAAVAKVSMAPAGAVRVTVTATPAAPSTRHPQIELGVNDCRLSTVPMPAELHDYEWTVDQPCWHAGNNELSIGVTPHRWCRRPTRETRAASAPASERFGWSAWLAKKRSR